LIWIELFYRKAGHEKPRSQRRRIAILDQGGRKRSLHVRHPPVFCGSMRTGRSAGILAEVISKFAGCTVRMNCAHKSPAIGCKSTVNARHGATIAVL
jgi:hypothetical protein